MKNYIVLDLETPNRLNENISSIALLIVKDNKIVKKIDQLINPQTYFEKFNIDLTGITPDMVKDSPTFDEYWNEISQYLVDNIIVGHNVQFDLRVLSTTLKNYGLEIPEFDYYCTLSLSRKFFNLKSYKLSNVAKHLNIRYRPHIALDDAYASYKIFEYINNQNNLTPTECKHYHYRLQSSDVFDPVLATNINNLYGMIYILKYYPTISSSQFNLLKMWYDKNKKYNQYTVFNNINSKLDELLSKKNITNNDIKYLLTRTPLVNTSDIYSDKTLKTQVLQGIINVIKLDNKVDFDELNYLYDWLLENKDLKGNYYYDRTLEITKKSLDNENVSADNQQHLSELFEDILNTENIFHDGPILFEDKTYCLTGDFETDSKSNIESMLNKRGLVKKTCVSSKLDYLFVGNFGNASWKYGNMGSKIVKAKKLINEGVDIKIVRESTLFVELDKLEK